MRGIRATCGPPQQTCDACELDASLTRFRGRWLCGRCLLGAEPLSWLAKIAGRWQNGDHSYRVVTMPKGQPASAGSFKPGPDPRRGPGGRAPLATAAWKRWCRNLTKRKRLEIETMALLDPGTMRTIIEQGHGKAHQSGDLEVKVGSLADLSDDELKAKLAAAMKALGG